MQELIDRMRRLLADSEVPQGQKHRGMHDLILAMEERMASLRTLTESRTPISYRARTEVESLWERV